MITHVILPVLLIMFAPVSALGAGKEDLLRYFQDGLELVLSPSYPEFVVRDRPGLSDRMDRMARSAGFRDAAEAEKVFESLSGDRDVASARDELDEAIAKRLGNKRD